MSSNSQSFLKEIDQAYNKLIAECSKNQSNIKNIIEAALKSIASLKQLDANNIDIYTQIPKELTLLLLPLQKVIEMELNKLYIPAIEIIKILVKYNTIPLSQTKYIITTIKELFGLIPEEDYLKIVDVLITMVNSCAISIDEETIEMLMTINLKLFSLNSNDINNPLKGLFVSILNIVYDSIQRHCKLNDKANGQRQGQGQGKDNKTEQYKAFYWLFKTLIDIADGKNKEMITPSICSKCLALELLSQIIDNNSDILITIPQLNNAIREDLIKLLLKLFSNNNEHLIAIKLCRCVSILLTRLHLGYELIPDIIKYAKTKEMLSLIKWLGLETISSMLKDDKLLNSLMLNQKYYEDILKFLNTISKAVNVSLSNSSSIHKKNSPSQNARIHTCKKYIDNNCIYTKNQAPIISIATTTTTTTISYIILDCYENLTNSLILILLANDISIGSTLLKNKHLCLNKSALQTQIAFKSELISDAFHDIIDKGAEDNILLQSYLALYQKLINIYGTIGLSSIRDEFISGLCFQAIPNNIQSIDELTEKHFLIIKSLFNILFCYHLFDFDFWIILLKPIQSLNYLLEKNQGVIVQGDHWSVANMKVSIEKNMRLSSNSTSHTEIKDILDEKLLGINEIRKTNSNSSTKTKKTNTNDNKEGNTNANDNKDTFNLFALSISVERWLVDSKMYDSNCIVDLINAININCQHLLFNPTPMHISYLKFNLKKVFEVAWINCYRINLIWSSVMTIIDNSTQTSERLLTLYSINICTALIIHSIKNFKVNPKQREEEWNELNYERTLITALLTFTNKSTSDESDICILNSLSSILKECGAELNIFGWSSFIETCSFVLNKNMQTQCELIFKIYETVINDYATYINPYNIRPLLTSLEIFSSTTINDSIPLMAISLFNSCANITESYQKGKVNMKNRDIEFFTNFLPDDKVKNDFYNEIWRSIFYKLLSINSDDRKEIRKAGIVIFSEIFSIQMSNISLANRNNIINEVFNVILNKNSEMYKEKIATVKNKDKVDNIVIEWEECSKVSLEEYKNVIKAYSSNYNGTNNDNKQNEYFELYISKCIDLLSYCRIEFTTQIIEGVDDLYKSNSKLILSNPAIYWKLLNKVGEYLINQTATFDFASKMLLEIISIVKRLFLSFLSNCSIEVDVNTLNDFLSYYHLLLSVIATNEKEEIDKNSDWLVDNEKGIFDLIDTIAKDYADNKKLLDALYYFYFKYFCYDSSNEHSEALCRRSIQSIKTLFTMKAFNYEEYIGELVDKMKQLYSLKNNIDIAVCLSKKKLKLLLSNRKSNTSNSNNSNSSSNTNNSSNSNTAINNKGIFLWSYIAIEGIEIIKSIFSTNDDLNESIWKVIISFITIFISKNDKGNHKQIPKNYHDDIIESYQDIEIDITNFIIDPLLTYSSITTGNKSLSKTIQNKLLILIEQSANIDYNSIQHISAQISKNSISHLIELCKYRPREELINGKEKWAEEDIGDYINIRVKISKTCTPVLIKRCRDIMRKFLIDEIKNGSMPLNRGRIEEIKFILENMKNLEIYPHYTVIDDETHLPDEDGLEDKETVMGVVAKTKKAHLFLLHPILSEFISTKENDIKVLIKEIFRRISKEMGIKSTLTIIESFYGK